jgi:pimeloyl-ACP methyl ester carboxylesterase
MEVRYRKDWGTDLLVDDKTGEKMRNMVIKGIKRALILLAVFAITLVTIRMYDTQRGPPLHLVGFSNGGALAWDAVVEAATSRFRPIMLTAISTVLGLIPIAPTIFTMAYAIMGGLLVATLLTLLFLPALYVDWFRVKEPRPDQQAKVDGVKETNIDVDERRFMFMGNL